MVFLAQEKHMAQITMQPSWSLLSEIISRQSIINPYNQKNMSIYDFSVKKANSEEMSLKEYDWKVLLIVNTQQILE